MTESPIARRAAVCIGIWCRKQLQGMATESGTSVRSSLISIQALQKVAERIQKMQVAELTGAHHPYRFEPKEYPQQIILNPPTKRMT